MNRPIRTLAVGCLLLFLALLLNINYVQVLKADDLNARAGQPRVLRRGVLPRARADPGRRRRRSRAACRADDDLKYIQRQYSRAAALRARHRLLLLHLRHDRHREQPRTRSCPAATPGCSSTGSIDLVGNEQPKGGSVLLTIDPAAQQAACDGLAARRARPGRGGRARPADRRRSWRWCRRRRTTPTCWPPTTRGGAQGATTTLLSTTPTSRCSTGPPRSSYPPGSTFKLVTAAAALSPTTTRPTPMVKGGAVARPAADRRTTCTTRTASCCGGDEITLTRALGVSCNVAFGDLGLELGADALREQAEKFGFNDDVLDELAPVAEQRLPGRPRRAADRAVRDRPVRRRGDAAADGDGGRRDRQRRRRDEAVRRRRRSARPTSSCSTRPTRRCCTRRSPAASPTS